MRGEDVWMWEENGGGCEISGTCARHEEGERHKERDEGWGRRRRETRTKGKREVSEEQEEAE